MTQGYDIEGCPPKGRLPPADEEQCHGQAQEAGGELEPEGVEHAADEAERVVLAQRVAV
jgi:hypothetical protein